MTLTQGHFNAARLDFYDEIGRRTLGKWPRMLLRPVIEGTLKRGRTWMYVQNLAALANAAGLSHRKEASIGLRQLVDWHILDVRPWPLKERIRASIYVGINVMFAQWTAPISHTYTEIEQWLNNLEQPEGPSLREVWLQCFIEEQDRKLLQISPMPRTVERPEGFAQTGHTAQTRDAGREPEGNESARPEAVGDSPTDIGRGSNPSPDQASVAAPTAATVVVPVAKSATAGPVERPAAVAKPETGSVAFFTSGTGGEKTATVSPQETGGEPAVAKSATETSATVPMARSAGAAVSPQTPLAIAIQQEQEQPGLNELPQIQSPSETLQFRSGASSSARAVAKSATEASGPDKPPRLTWQEARDLIDGVERVVGREEYLSRRVLWLEKMIYNFPNAVSATLDKLERLDQRGYFQPNKVRDAGRPPKTDHYIRWLMVAVAREAGVLRWPDVRPGPEPKE